MFPLLFLFKNKLSLCHKLKIIRSLLYGKTVGTYCGLCRWKKDSMRKPIIFICVTFFFFVFVANFKIKIRRFMDKITFIVLFSIALGIFMFVEKS